MACKGSSASGRVLYRSARRGCAPTTPSSTSRLHPILVGQKGPRAWARKRDQRCWGRRWRVRGDHRAGGPAGGPERPAPPHDRPTRPPTTPRDPPGVLRLLRRHSGVESTGPWSGCCAWPRIRERPATCARCARPSDRRRAGHRGRLRRRSPGLRAPYGWGWALLLAHELSTWDDPDARRSANLGPLADTIAELLLAWLARATYPSRDGTHANSAFGLVRALPLARARTHHGDPSLAGAIVSDPTDGQIAHLHGLNLYRAYAYPAADPDAP
jgi:Protein of unknown function (DUF2891)